MHVGSDHYPCAAGKKHFDLYNSIIITTTAIVMLGSIAADPGGTPVDLQRAVPPDLTAPNILPRQQDVYIYDAIV